MTKLISLLLATTFTGLTASAHAEVYPSRLIYRISAGIADMFANTHYWERSVENQPIIRPDRIPLHEVKPCEGEGCVIVNGRKITLEPSGQSLMHGRVRVIGVERREKQIGIYARVRFGPWVNSEPDYLHVWATAHGRGVKLVGYSILRKDEVGREDERLAALPDLSLFKFLTSKNPVEIEVARELAERRVFCTNYPADPVESIRDDVAPLEAHGLIGDAESRTRLGELNAVAALIDRDRGQTKCESPATEQIDIVLDRVRAALESFARAGLVRAKSVTAPAPKVEVPAPSPAPPTKGIPFLTPAHRGTR